MAEKFRQSEVKEEKKVGKEIKAYKQSDSVFLTFRKNRKFDLHIGRKMWTFQGREKLELPKTILGHKDFTENIKKNFIIQEV